MFVMVFIASLQNINLIKIRSLIFYGSHASDSIYHLMKIAIAKILGSIMFYLGYLCLFAHSGV